MSKIQEALRKLQRERKDSSSAGARQGDRTNVVSIPRQEKEPESEAEALAALEEVDTRERIRLSYQNFESSGHLAEHPAMLPELTTEFREIADMLLSESIRGTGADERSGGAICITSSSRGDGKTFVALNLALILLQRDASRVLLVDADTENSEITRCLGLEDRIGAAELACGEHDDPEEHILATTVSGLEVLPAGQPGAKAEPADLASFVDKITAAQPKRIVVMDMPVAVGTSAAWDINDDENKFQFVLLARAGETRRGQLQESLKQLEKASALAVLLNQV